MTAIQNIEQRLNQLRATLAQAKRWSPAWMQAWLAEAHLSAELARLERGLTGCGCSLCRESRATAQATLRVTKVAKPMGKTTHVFAPGQTSGTPSTRLRLKKMAELTGVSHMTIKRRLSGRGKG